MLTSGGHSSKGALEDPVHRKRLRLSNTMDQTEDQYDALMTEKTKNIIQPHTYKCMLLCCTLSSLQIYSDFQ
jgi:hypothetical protein